MDILIQSEETKLFLATQGGWTAERKGAVSFPNSPAALNHCVKNELKAVNLLFCYGNPALNFTIDPFSDPQPTEITSRTAIQDSVYVQAQNQELKQANRQLRSELDSLIAEGKERRKRRAFPSSFHTKKSIPNGMTESSQSLLAPQFRPGYRPVASPPPSTNALAADKI